MVLANTAVPSRPAWRLRMIDTGISRIRPSKGSLALKAMVKVGVSNAFRIFAGMPPPMKTPPVARPDSAKLPAAAPKIPSHSSRASTQCGQRYSSAASLIRAGRSEASPSLKT